MKDENAKRAIVLFGIVLFLSICAFIALCSKPSEASEAKELSAKEVMTVVWNQSYPPSLKTEVFFGREDDEGGRNIAAWTDLESKKAEIFIGKYRASKGFVGRSGGTFYDAAKNDLGYEVHVSRETGRRAKVKKKSSSFDALANQTQMSYFDIMRSLFQENPEKFKFSFTDDASAIKATPVNYVKGDYAHRLFYLGITTDGSLIITRVEYFSQSGDRAKIRVSSNFRKYAVGDSVIWRPENVSVVSIKGATKIRFTKRKFNIDFGDISKKDLKKGRPPKWRD